MEPDSEPEGTTRLAPAQAQAQAQGLVAGA